MTATSSADDRAAEGPPRYPTVALLLARPRLAYLYTELLLRDGWSTTRDLVAATEFSQSTVYEDLRELRDTSLVSVRKSGRERRYRAEPFEVGVLDGGLTRVTPTVVAAVGRQAVDEDVERFVADHGVATLVEAVGYAKSHVEGRMTEGVAARELGVPRLVAATVLVALEDTLREMKEADPYYDDVRDAAAEGGPARPREVRFDDHTRVVFEARDDE